MEVREHWIEETKISNYYYIYLLIYLLCIPPPTFHVRKNEEAKIKVFIMVNF